MRKIFRITHKWLSIPVGLIISIVCLSGAALVFKEEILELSNPSHYFVEEVKDKAIPLSELIPMVNNQLTDNAVTNVKITSNPKRTYVMTLTEGFRISIFVNPYTGDITGKYDTRDHYFWDIMVLHRWLMDGTRTWGKYTVGISTLIMIFILIGGLILWIPRKKKHWKQSLTIKTKAGRRRLFFDLHNVLGAYTCLILLICCLSGLMWSFEWYRNGVFKLFGAEIVKTEGKGRGNSTNEKKELPKVDANHWQTIFEKVALRNPGYEYIRVQESVANVHDKNAFLSRQTDTYKFDNKTGELGDILLYRHQPKTTQIWGWAYSLHVGDYFGIWSKILTCLASLIGASLPITGYYLFYSNLKKKDRSNKK